MTNTRLLDLAVSLPGQGSQVVGMLAALGQDGLVAGRIQRVLQSGPGKVVCGLVQRIAPNLKCHALGEPVDFEATFNEIDA